MERFDPADWADETSDVSRHITKLNEESIEAWRGSPRLVFEHANIERATAQGGYGRRQLYELIQNGADALVGTRSGRIHVVKTERALYCANMGEPIDINGLDALLGSHISMKRGAEIGRFGLGFKSVLTVTDSPELYSWSASFRFNKAWSRDQIFQDVPGYQKIIGTGVVTDDRTPVLRLAQHLDPITAAEDDPTLKSLMAWATTVVRLPFNQGEGSDAQWLSEDIEKFPPEFLLFSPHVAEVRLEDHVNSVDRRIELINKGSTHQLMADGQSSDWLVFAIPDYTPSKAARRDAGELAHRESVPIIWAVPTAGERRQATGAFWAFFPTEYETTLAGILNAPWKTNEDRQNLLTGVFNEELISRTGQLVVDSLADLLDPEDPGYYLEMLPGRGREARNWADQLLTDTVWALTARTRSLPDVNGNLRNPSELNLHPTNATTEALEIWNAYAARPSTWCHMGVTANRDRAARASRIMEEFGASPKPVWTWLEALVEDGSIAGSAAAIRAAAAQRSETSLDELRTAEIVLAADGTLVTPDPDTVLIPRSSIADADVLLVHPELAADAMVLSALIALGLREVDAFGELNALVTHGLSAGKTDWERFWELAASLNVQDAAPLIVDALCQGNFVGVRVHDGSWRDATEVLIPGEILSDNAEHSFMAVDVNYHADHLELFEAIGVFDAPRKGRGRTYESWFGNYRVWALGTYYEQLAADSSRPVEEKLVFDRETFVGPARPLLGLNPQAKARFCEILLSRAHDDRWTMSHQTISTYPKCEMLSPDLWLVRQSGLLPTTSGPRPVDQCVAPALRTWAALLPVVDVPESHVIDFELPQRLVDLADEQWAEALERAAVTPRSDLAARFYAEAAEIIDAPERVACMVGDTSRLIAPKSVTVVWNARQLAALQDQEVPVLLAPSRDAAAVLVERWGLSHPDDRVRVSLVPLPSAIDMPIIEIFPDLLLALDDHQMELRLQPCQSLQTVTLTDAGSTSEATEFAFEAGVIYFLDTLSDADLLDRVCSSLGITLLDDERQGIIERRSELEARKHAQRIAREPDDEARLATLFGAARLRRYLPGALLGTVEHGACELIERDLARLALAVHGVAVLKVMRDELVDLGFRPPGSWTGSTTTKRFVASLGFDERYAGVAPERWSPVERVYGPSSIPPLHEFQQSIYDEIRRLLRGEGGLRGVLGLPTGAGKTRVTVQSIVESVRDGDTFGPILWVAQTEELCEQAVQAWSEVWRTFGPDAQLSINRLWASREADPIETGFQVVVATIAKLRVCLDKSAYSWLGDARCIVIDEAHQSTTPSYTDLLRWLKMDRNRERAPLIGLTATPYRGRSDEQTERLANRYGRRRLDEGAFGDGEAYKHLQALGVLSEVDHQLLDGTEIELSGDELATLEKTSRLPASVEERVGADRDRNETLLRSILGLPDDWPVLVFAASVDHAQTMAALLTLKGVAASVISSTTELTARRAAIAGFRSGDTRVLTNYGVLAHGFDAPAVRAVYVARPTFSPNLYQQMIGRGLRGPRNGGKDRCLIVNVRDNVDQYGVRLAFNDFEYMWDRSTAG